MLTYRATEYTHGALQFAGLLPSFVLAYDGSSSFKETLEGQYGFPLYEVDGQINDQDEYCYPEDEPLPKLLDIEVSNGACLTVYQYAIVRIKEPDGSYIITRMD